ncbi:leucine-rich repeat protein [Winogradskyella flava]|uniref:leucine-rich repeat protein n=1 Tax=Winogradskyella flava TaxID=1884876 RepID=UPI00249046C2|nr:leucine-rich repeat protein [Winogradskyella flava]
MKTKLLTLLTFLCITISFAQTFTDNGLTYNVLSTNPNEVELIGGTPATLDLIIPEIVNDGTDDFTVTSVGDQAFQQSGLTSVNFPPTITAIGEEAFQQNQLVNLILPQNLLSLGFRSFQGNILVDVTFPDGLPAIGEATFSGNQITSLNIPASVTSIEAVAFRNNPLTSLTLSEGLLTIGDEAFRINQLTSLTLPSTVTSVGAQAFETNDLTSVNALASIPPSITTGTDDSFGNNRINITLFVPSGNVQAYIDAGWTGFASITDAIIAPYTEDFEAFTTSGSAFVTENGWTATGGDYFWEAAPGTDTGSSDTGPDPSITTGNYFYTEASDGVAGDITDLVSPLVDLTNLTAPALTFNYHMFGSQIGTLEVLVNGTDNVFSLSGQQQTSATADWGIAQINLSAYAGQTISVTFRGTSAGQFEGDIAIDNIVFDDVSCFAPSNLSASNITDNSADLSWIENGTATVWDLELIDVTAGETATGTPTATGINNPSFSATGLTEDNDYAFFVRADCGTDGVSDWAGPFNFITPCAAFTAPYSEDFESFMTSSDAFIEENCWTATGSGGYSWEAAPGTDTGSDDTGPDPSITTGNYFYTEASNGSNGNTTDLVSPMIDLTNLTTPGLLFDYHMFGDAIGTLNVLVNGTDNVFSRSGEQQTSATENWRLAIIDLSAYAGQTIFVTFRGTRGNGFEGDISIDNVVFDELPSCTPVEGTAVIGVTDCTGANTFFIDVDVTNLGDATTVTISNDAGIAATDVTTTGVVAIGPFNSGSTINISLDHDTDPICSANLGNFTFSCPPPNDDCTNAIALTIPLASTCPANTIVNTVAATEGADELTSCDESGNLGIWYSFTAPASGQMEFTSGTGNPGITIFEGTCDALTEVPNTCFNNESGSIIGLTPGNPYFAMIWTDNPEPNAEFCLFSLPCAVATATATVVEDCANNQFTVDVDVTNLGSSATLTISNDAGVAPTDVSTTGVVNIGPFTPGIPVTITLENESDSACDLVLPTVNSLCPPLNDECTTAILIAQETDIADVANATANPGSLSGATDSGLAAETCNGFTGTADDDVWYTFEALTNDVNITFDATFDSVVQLYSGTCGALTVIDCADNNFDVGVEEITATGLTIGEIYTIRIYSFGGGNDTAGFTFDLSIWSPSTLSTNDVETENPFTYYPNPVKNTLTLNAKQNIDAVVMYNMLGQNVLTTTPNSLNSKLDMSHLQNGTYFVKVTVNSITETIRVIKQ